MKKFGIRSFKIMKFELGIEDVFELSPPNSEL